MSKRLVTTSGAQRGELSDVPLLIVGVEAEVDFNHLLDAAPDAIVGMDSAGNMVVVNRGCEQLLGYVRRDLYGMQARMVLAEDERDRMISLTDRLFQQPDLRAATQHVDTRFQRRDGTQFAGEVSMSWLELASGTVLLAVIRDLTELHRAESRFQNLLEVAPDAIVGCDREGIIVLMNVAAERLLGYPRDALIGRSYETVLPPHLLGEMREEYVRAFTTIPDPSRVIRADVLRADGTTVPVEAVVTRFEEDSEDFVLCSIRDMRAWQAAEAERQQLVAEVEQSRTEHVMEQAQRMEALGQLAGGVAHDFNNLLAVILNYSSLVGEELDELDSAAPGRWAPLRADIEHIQHAADRGAALTKQLLALGRRDVVHPEVLLLNVAVMDMTDLLKTSLGGHIGLRTDLAEDLWPVLIDVGHIKLILVNLAVNARDAMPAGGSLVIRSTNVEVGDDVPGVVPGRYVQLRISDTGEGMPPEVAKRAFEPFYTTKATGRGTGLGLAMVYGVVTQAGGTVSLDSRPGVGTECNIFLPATEEAPHDPPIAEPHTRHEHHEVILVAEDEEGIREVVTRVLTGQGYRVLAAPDGPAALEFARAHVGDVDLLLTDVIMPGMLGKELADRVTAMNPAVRVVFMSGYAPALLTADGTIDNGAILIEKPFAPTTLLDTLDRVLGTGAGAVKGGDVRGTA